LGLQAARREKGEKGAQDEKQGGKDTNQSTKKGKGSFEVWGDVSPEKDKKGWERAEAGKRDI